MKYNTKKIAVIALFVWGVTLPALTQAAPRALLQNAQTYALDNTFHAFRVPTVDSQNIVRFYDVKVNLVVAADGTISPNAIVTRAPSLPIGTLNVQPGTYQETGGIDRCTVTNITLSNGRIQSFFRCANGTSAANTFEFSVATGTISAGHPFLAELLLKKVNLRTDVATQSWGIITSAKAFHIGNCDVGAGVGSAVGVKTNGSLMTVTLINNGALPNTFCAPTMTKLP